MDSGSATSCQTGIVGGIGGAKAIEFYYHDVYLKISSHTIKTFVGFSKDLPVSAPMEKLMKSLLN